MITGTEAEYQSAAGSKKDTSYLVLMGELWVVFLEITEFESHALVLPALEG